MIIQCEKCQTRFRLDDSRVTDKGVKVRCTKCKYVFTVQKPGPDAESFEPEVALTGFSLPAVPGEAASHSDDNQSFVAASVPDAPVDSGIFQDTPNRGVSGDFSALASEPFDPSAISFESDELDTNAAENDSFVDGEPAAKGGEVDFSSFDFDDSYSVPDSPPLSALSVEDFTAETLEPAAPAPQKIAAQGLDFSDDDMFGSVVQAVPEASSDSISFDFEGDSFAESMEMSSQESTSKSSTLFSLDTPGDAPFNLGEIDFGDELTSVAVQHVNPEDLKPSQEILFAPLAEAQAKPAEEDLARAFLGDALIREQQELPPLSIASRRKQSPLFGVLIAVIAVLVVSVLGYLGYSSFSTPKETAAPESGKIGVRAVKAAFIENDEAGELLVISGEALNEFPKPRAALQVKVSVFDAAGQSLAAKTAYCGNPLTAEQLESLSLEKIETAMANQFGDSLANMEVAPGKAIPFVIVLANVPKGAKNLAVESAGSTVATGKQQ